MKDLFICLMPWLAGLGREGFILSFRVLWHHRPTCTILRFLLRMAINDCLDGLDNSMCDSILDLSIRGGSPRVHGRERFG